MLGVRVKTFAFEGGVVKECSLFVMQSSTTENTITVFISRLAAVYQGFISSLVDIY